ncbi:MAG: hypothetical protein DHS20C12_16610 [Pseudohongiella sp.]|nr:MAG: hypothetical protein DHS20C12_16610 [Pseudohongiella sp.]
MYATKMREDYIYTRTLLPLFAAALLVSCAASPETQAKMDEYARTIPICSSDAECQRKWSLAREWTVENSDFNIRGEGDTRIHASSNIISQGGVGVVVTKVANGANEFQIVADLECFSAYGCPDIWDLKIDFNQTLNNAAE